MPAPSRAHPSRAHRALAAIRVAVATLLVVHGIARITLGIVDDFGGFLTAVGLPAGLPLAWSISVFEIVGGIVLAAGRWIRPIALLYAVELAVGIGLVHWSEGWFVVGAGRNGMEYSILLIATLLAVAWADDPGQVENAETMESHE